MKYLVTEFTGLGNFIQRTPMIKSISKIDPEAEVFLIGDNRWGGLEVLRGTALVKDIFSISKNSDNDGILSWINNKKFDVVLDPPGTYTPNRIFQIFYESNAKRIVRCLEMVPFQSSNIIGMLRNYLRFIISLKKVTYVKFPKGIHEIDTNYDTLEAFIGKTVERSYQTHVSFSPDSQVLKKFNLTKNKYICLQPSARGGNPTPKTWHPNNFISLAYEIQVFYPNYNIVLLGDKGDLEKVINNYTWPDFVKNLAGKTNMNELVNLLFNSSCTVCHDSGIMHLANGLKVPLIALYGPTDYSWTAPRGKNTKVLFSKTESFGIMSKLEKTEPQLAEMYPDHVAMSGISVDSVFETIRGMV